MIARNTSFVRAGLFALASLSAALGVAPSTPAVAADLPPPPRAGAWSWWGPYIGGEIGAFAGTATFSDPYGSSIFGDKANTSGFLAGLQLGYDWQVNRRWVVGVVGDVNYLDGRGDFTCLQASTTLIGSNCEANPRMLAAMAGRLGYVLEPLGETLLYGKAGAAWNNTGVTITANHVPSSQVFPGATSAGAPTNTNTGAWGGMVGVGLEHTLTPAWSIGLEYDYYRFATTDVATPLTINVTRSTRPSFTDVAGSTSGVSQDIQVIKLALNYHLGRDPWAMSADVPLLPIDAFATKAPPLAVWDGWQVDAGARYWYSSGREKNTSGTGSLGSQLTYSNLTGQSGEFFARVDTPSRMFVKGFVGAGAMSGGKQNDEDWGLAEGARPQIATAYEVTVASASGWLKYAVADVGYNVFQNPNYKVGPFVGYSYFRQSLNAFGCTQLTTPGSACDPPFPSNKPIISEDETWQSLRVGVSAAATIWNRFEINGDVAYLPYAQYSGLDSHLARPSILYFPQTGTGRGVQTEFILTYLMTENLKLGIGGRYWAMWTDGARQGCRGACSGTGDEVNSAPYTADTERFGGFVQASYRFTTQP